MQTDNLIAEGDYMSANYILDSLIGIDTTVGHFYFQRAFCNTQFMLHEAAIKDYKRSYDLSYKQGTCNEMIKFNEMLLEAPRDAL